jgi:ADP-ribose pyrophosphatase YjhB (NUDIX family)
MYVTTDMIDDAISRWGEPLRQSFVVETSDAEIEFIRSTQKNGRAHDITLYIKKDDQLVVIAKPFYPPDLFRAPSGGLNPGESIEAGAKREALEETGCQIELKRFLLTSSVSFASGSQSLEWTSYVFAADYFSGDFNFTDTREIREVRLADLAEFELFDRIMRESDKAGLHYRARLHTAVSALL